MLKIDNSLLQELGLAGLPEAEKNSFLKHIYETLEMRVGIRLADQMSNEQLDEFERYFEAKDDAGAFKWLETNFPNYKDIVQQEFDKLKGEVAQSAPQILSASQQAAQGSLQQQQIQGQPQPQQYAQQPQAMPQQQPQPQQYQQQPQQQQQIQGQPQPQQYAQQPQAMPQQQPQPQQYQQQPQPQQYAGPQSTDQQPQPQQYAQQPQAMPQQQPQPQQYQQQPPVDQTPTQ